LGLTAEQAAKAADAFEADDCDYCQVSGTSVTAFAMSAIGPKRTSLVAPHMSAFGGKADMATLYSTFGNCGHFAPHRSLILSADFFFGQSAVNSSSQSSGA